MKTFFSEDKQKLFAEYSEEIKKIPMNKIIQDHATMKKRQKEIMAFTHERRLSAEEKEEFLVNEVKLYVIEESVLK